MTQREIHPNTWWKQTANYPSLQWRASAGLQVSPPATGAPHKGASLSLKLRSHVLRLLSGRESPGWRPHLHRKSAAQCSCLLRSSQQGLLGSLPLPPRLARPRCAGTSFLEPRDQPPPAAHSSPAATSCSAFMDRRDQGPGWGSGVGVRECSGRWDSPSRPRTLSAHQPRGPLTLVPLRGAPRDEGPRFGRPACLARRDGGSGVWVTVRDCGSFSCSSSQRPWPGDR